MTNIQRIYEIERLAQSAAAQDHPDEHGNLLSEEIREEYIRLCEEAGVEPKQLKTA